MQTSLPKRKSVRLKNYDYAQNGYYFITICTHNKEPLFWDMAGTEENGRQIAAPTESTNFKGFVGADSIRPQDSSLSEYGKIADKAICAVSSHYPTVKIDRYVIMPDHIHLILIIQSVPDKQQIAAPAIMRVIGQMKRWVSKEIGHSIWQKSYYEHIIRNEADYARVLEYMDNNPLVRQICSETETLKDS